MATEFPELTFSDEEDFDADRLNKAMRTLDARLRNQESLRVSYTEAIDTLNRFGLQRLNEAVQPVYDELMKISQIGLIFSAASQTPQSMEAGLKTFIISGSKRRAFAPTAYIQARYNPDPTLALFGTTQSYDPETGALVVLIDQINGEANAPLADWMVMPASTPDLITDAYTRGEIDTMLALVATRQAAQDKQLSDLNIALGTTIGGLTNRVGAVEGNRLRYDAQQSLTTAQIGNVLTTLGVNPFVRGLFGAANEAGFRQAIGAQSNLGFTPIEQGGGAGQGNNKLRIGWDGRMRVQVDNSDVGRLWLDRDAPFFGSPNGYQILPTGLIIQWGTVPSGPADQGGIAFPTAFPSTVFSVVATPYGPPPGTTLLSHTIDELTRFSFALRRRQVDAGGVVYQPDPGTITRWLAVGM